MELETITASYSRKIQHEHYGGAKFEGSDHFCSMSATLDEGDDPTVAHNELMLACREMVGTSIAYDIRKIQGGAPWHDFMSKLRDYRLGKLELTDDVWKSWNELQKSIYEEMKKLKRTVAPKGERPKESNRE